MYVYCACTVHYVHACIHVHVHVYMYMFLYVQCTLYVWTMHTQTHTHAHSLPPAVSYSLLVQLTKYYPLKSPKCPSPSSDTEGPSRLLRETPVTLTAHVLYCHWVLRFLTLSQIPPDISRSANTWDITCATPEQIKSLVSHITLY